SSLARRWQAGSRFALLHLARCSLCLATHARAARDLNLGGTMNRRPVLRWPRTRGRVWLVLVLGVVAAGAAAGAVWASIPDANGVIHGCFKTVSGQLRIVQSAADCNPAATAIAWNQTRPPGPPPPVADRTLWISPLAFQAGQFGGNLTFDRGSFGDTLTIGSTAAGDLQWVNAPLSLPSDLKVKQVTVCYSDASAA